MKRLTFATLAGLMLIVFLGVMPEMMGASVQAGTWWEDFNDGNFDGWETLTIAQGPGPAGDWAVVDGELVAERNGTSIQIVVGEFDWKNYSIEAKIKLIRRLSPPQIPLAGIAIRKRGGAYYMFFLTFDWNGKGGLVGGIAKAPPIEKGFLQFRVQTNVWYKLKVEAQNNTFRAFLDDELAFEFDDHTHGTGKVGLTIRFMEAHFDDIVITGPDVPDNGKPSAVSPQAKLATTWATVKQGR